MLALLVAVAGAALIATSSAAMALLAYVALAVAASALIAPAAAGAPLPLALFAATTLLKVVVAPLGILWFVRSQPAARALRPHAGLPFRLLLAIVLAALAASVPPLAHVAMLPLQIGLYLVGIAAAMLVVHRALIAHVIALLALGAGITLCGTALAPALPESVELGATLDTLVGTFVALALIRAFAFHAPLLDVDDLRRLRG